MTWIKELSIKHVEAALDDIWDEISGSSSTSGASSSIAITTSSLPGATGATGPAGTDAMQQPIGTAIDGGGANISTGSAGYVEIVNDITIVSASLLGEVVSGTTGSAVIDIWVDTVANFPPTVADTITAAAKPTISSGVYSKDTTLTGWSTSLNAGDVIWFNVDSCSNFQRLRLTLEIV